MEGRRAAPLLCPFSCAVLRSSTKLEKAVGVTRPRVVRDVVGCIDIRLDAGSADSCTASQGLGKGWNLPVGCGMTNAAEDCLGVIMQKKKLEKLRQTEAGLA
jgi:hypothetical protein